MSNLVQNNSTASVTTKSLFARPDVQAKMAEMLGKRSTSFITSVLQIVNSNDLLKKSEPNSVYHAAMVAATLDLPINNSLGMAYIVPFQNRSKGIVEATFQIGAKGFVQLALRSGQFKTISYTEVYEGQLISENPLTGFEFDFTKKVSDKVVGYASYFKLLNGFESTYYMSTEQVNKHALRYSQTYKKGYGQWKDDFDAMAKKTVLKLNLSKFAPLSVEMQNAIQADQAVIKDSETMDVSYTDNTDATVVTINIEDKETERLKSLISQCKTTTELEILLPEVGDNLQSFYQEKYDEILGNLNR